MRAPNKGLVLAGIDGSVSSDAVIDYAIWFSKQVDQPLKLLHTIEHRHHSEQVHREGNLTPNIREHLLDELSDEERIESKQLIAQGKEILANAKQKAQQAGVGEVIAKQRHGSLPEALMDLESEIALVVLGATGVDHANEKQGLGAQLEDAIRVINKPVFIAKHKFSEPKKIMFAYNGSPTSQKALNLLAQSKLFTTDIEIHVVCVQKTSVEADHLIEDAEHAFEEAGISVISQAYVGEPVKVLTQYQQDKAIDITVMGAFSHGKLHGFFFGSLTTKMLIEGTSQYLLIR
jgi:nucleotide-binding universal stress UspA family protein